jgi:hypothetical protein
MAAAIANVSIRGERRLQQGGAEAQPSVLDSAEEGQMTQVDGVRDRAGEATHRRVSSRNTPSGAGADGEVEHGDQRNVLDINHHGRGPAAA